MVWGGGGGGGRNIHLFTQNRRLSAWLKTIQRGYHQHTSEN